MKDKSIAQVLRDAADLIEPEGAWTQGNLYKFNDGLKCFCILGAINEVGGNYVTGSFVDKLLPPTKAGGLRPAAFWNDDPERTQAQVVAKLREAAALAEEQAL